jgi:uncharacterized protein YqhQ
MKPSGIGGQAVIEGIMMRNKDQYSIAVRKPDNEIEVTVRDCNQLQKKHPWLNYPIIRGVYSFGFFSNGNFHNQLFGFVL